MPENLHPHTENLPEHRYRNSSSSSIQTNRRFCRFQPLIWRAGGGNRQLGEQQHSHRSLRLIRQGCEARGITIVRGSIGKDHVYMLVGYSPSIAPSKIVQYLKGRSSRLIQDEFPELKKRYWGQHLWVICYKNLK